MTRECSTTGFFDAADLGFAKPAADEIGDNADAELVPIDMLPSQREHFADPQSRRRAHKIS